MNLGAQSAWSMYYLARGIGGIRIFGDFDLERLNVVVLMVMMDISSDLWFDNFGYNMVNGFMDDGYYIQPWSSIDWLSSIRLATCV